jgi:hypothetical protein
MYSARFSPPVMQGTAVVYKENDFHTIERNLEGEYSCWYIFLGFYPYALEIPLGDPRLFSNALAELYGSSKELAEGKSTQMVNWTLDSDILIIPIPYVMPARRTAKFRADMIEYTK